MLRSFCNLAAMILLALCTSCASKAFYYEYHHDPTPEEEARIGNRRHAPKPESQGIYTIRRIAPEKPPRLFMEPSWEAKVWDPAELGFLSHAWPTSKYKGARVFFKMLHDGERVYAIFYGYDRYMRAVYFRPQTLACRDNAVEFFFAPAGLPGGYCNIEISVSGAYLAQFHPDSQTVWRNASPLRSPIETCSSINCIVANEVKDNVEWCVAFIFNAKDVLREMGLDDSKPLSGQTWQANFYHCAENSSHKRWFSWAPLQALNFHRPQDFQPIQFE
ncbi:MAG: carbohydrate-binding family 9-like protein [Lentisphaeria bacterium]|nr:carbohydrate-binding family 9-like protein [Lentisphaeria bacterium]